MGREILIKAKAKNWKELPKEQWWIYGSHCKRKTGRYTDIGFEEEYKDCIIKEFSDGGITFCDVDPETICRCTGKEYMNCAMAYEGDIFESQSCGLRMVLKYGTYQAYCPADKCYMDSVGFYAEAIGYQQMPIGDLKDYALKIGNIFDNPELLEVQNEKENR